MITILNATPAQLRKAADIQEKIQSLQEELGQLLGGDSSTAAQTTEAPKKRKVSAAGRARMRAAQIARWAKIKGAAQEAEPAQKPKKRKMSAAGRAAISAAAKARWAKLRAK